MQRNFLTIGSSGVNRSVTMTPLTVNSSLGTATNPWNTINLSNVADGTHVATALPPHENSSYWFIPFDPNHVTNPINSSNPTPPTKVRIDINQLHLFNANLSTLGLRFATEDNVGIEESLYAGNGIYIAGTQDVILQPVTGNYFPVFSGSTINNEIILTGYIDIRFANNDLYSIASVSGVLSSVVNNRQQTFNGSFMNANVPVLTGISLFSTNSDNYLDPPYCSATVTMYRS